MILFEPERNQRWGLSNLINFFLYFKFKSVGHAQNLINSFFLAQNRPLGLGLGLVYGSGLDLGLGICTVTLLDDRIFVFQVKNCYLQTCLKFCYSLIYTV